MMWYRYAQENPATNPAIAPVANPTAVPTVDLETEFTNIINSTPSTPGQDNNDLLVSKLNQFLTKIPQTDINLRNKVVNLINQNTNQNVQFSTEAPLAGQAGEFLSAFLQNQPRPQAQPQAAVSPQNAATQTRPLNQQQNGVPK